MDGTADLTKKAFLGTVVEELPETRRVFGLRSILVGNGSLVVECAALLQRQGHTIVAVVASRGPAADWARRSGMRVFSQGSELLAHDLGGVDYLFVVPDREELPLEALSLPSRAAIAFHDGPLPDYAGLNTPMWALLNGEVRHGVTWHLISPTSPAGDILALDAIEIEPGETTLSLKSKCFEAGLRRFALLVEDLDAAVTQAVSQKRAPTRSFGRADRPPAAATIDWNHAAEDIAGLVNALDFGRNANPVAAPKALLGNSLVLIQKVTVLNSCSGLQAGIRVPHENALVVATGTADLRIDRFSDLEGRPLSSEESSSITRFTSLDPQRKARLSDLNSVASRHEDWWIARLETREALQLPQFRAGDDEVAPEWVSMDHWLGSCRSGAELLSLTIAWLARAADREVVEVGYLDSAYLARLENVGEWFAPELPIKVHVEFGRSLESLNDVVQAEIAGLHERATIARDLIVRYPELRNKASLAQPVSIQFVDRLDHARPGSAGTVLQLAICTNGLACRWTWDKTRLGSAEAEDLWLGFAAMLAAADVSAETAVGALSILSPPESERILAEWNATDTSRLEVPGYFHLVAEQARRIPHHTAVTAGGMSLTYAELDARSNSMARQLRALGVERKVLVGLHVARSIEMLVCLLAIHKAGGAYVPLDPSYPQDRIAHMIADSRMRLILTETQLREDLPGGETTIVCIDELSRDGALFSADPLNGGAGPEDLAYVIYTSGSTGLPKGVMVEHRNVLNFFAGMDRHLEPDGTWLAVTSLSFDISVLELCWTLTRGYHVVIAAEREVRGEAPLHELMGRHGVTHLQCTPSLLHILLADEDARPRLAALSRLMIGGEAFPPQLARDATNLIGGAVMNMYGPTETTVWSAVHVLDGMDQVPPLGRPLANQQIYILDRRLQPVRPGTPGELVIGGDGVVRGYLNRPELTAERFVPHPILAGMRAYRTGDLARQRADGTLEFLGRLDHQVKIRGHRIELGEIEAALAGHEQISEALLIARTDDGAARLVAYLVPVDGNLPSPDALRAHLRACLPEFMVPSNFVLLDALPRTPNGKVDRKALPEPGSVREVGAEEGPNLVSPQTPLESHIRAIWCDMLKLSRVGLEENFFDLGGNSLLAVQFTHRLRKETGHVLPLAAMLNEPTVAGLARIVENEAFAPPLRSTPASEEPAPSSAGVLTIRDGGALPPLFFIHEGQGETLVYRGLALRLDPARPVLGIEPLRTAEGDFAHTRIDQMASEYVERVRVVQPAGPYLLAGFCAGGTIAFEMAQQLQEAGETVAFLGIIEAVDAQATKRPFFITRRRIARLQKSLSQSGTSLLPELGRKCWNVLSFEVNSRIQKRRERLTVQRMRGVSQEHSARSLTAPSIPFLRLYEIAQREHRPRGILKGATVALFKATEETGREDDLPYRMIYSDVAFGWGKRFDNDLVIADVPGGHFSLLQEPHVNTLAPLFQNALDDALSAFSWEEHGRADCIYDQTAIAAE